MTLVDKVQAMIDEDPAVSMRKLGRVNGVCDRTIRKIVNQDLRYKSYVMQRGQLLTTALKERRLAFQCTEASSRGGTVDFLLR